MSLSDPQSRWTGAIGGPAFSTNYLIDVKHGVIMDVEATPAHRTAEIDSTKTMVDRAEARFEITLERLIGETGYGTAPTLARMVDEKVSSRTFRCGINQIARTTASRAATSSGMKRPTIAMS